MSRLADFKKFAEHFLKVFISGYNKKHRLEGDVYNHMIDFLNFFNSLAYLSFVQKNITNGNKEIYSFTKSNLDKSIFDQFDFAKLYNEVN